MPDLLLLTTTVNIGISMIMAIITGIIVNMIHTEGMSAEMGKWYKEIQ